ncbi:hypothetical protein KAR34_06545 [bacterium]|nr:hypothetical protein [bacterium]
MEAICGDKKYDIQFVATKILLGRLRLNYKRDSSPGQVNNYAEEMRNFFSKNQHIPMAMDDLREIMRGL